MHQFVQKYLNIPEDELAASWNGGMPLLNRMLYANLEALPPNLLMLVVGRLTSDKYLLAADHEKLMRIGHLCTANPFPLDFVGRLEALSKSCVHNAFHYEVLTYATATQNSALMASTNAGIAELGDLMARYD